MAVLVLHSANHAWDFVIRAEGCGPVGDGQARVIAGDEGSGDNQKERRARGEDCETVQSLMIPDFDAFQSSPPRTTGVPEPFILTEYRP